MVTRRYISSPKFRRPKGRTVEKIIANIIATILKLYNPEAVGYYLDVQKIAKASGLSWPTVKRYLGLLFTIKESLKDFDIMKVGKTYRVRPKFVKTVRKEILELLEEQ